MPIAVGTASALIAIGAHVRQSLAPANTAHVCTQEHRLCRIESKLDAAEEREREIVAADRDHERELAEADRERDAAEAQWRLNMTIAVENVKVAVDHLNKKGGGS